MAKDLQSRLIELLGNPAMAAVQVDLTRAAALRQQEVMLRQRAGAAAARARLAKEEGEEPDKVAALEAVAERRLTRLAGATGEAEAADLRRPPPQGRKAQIFGRATGEVEKPPLTAAALSAKGEVLARSAANKRGIFHLSASEAFEEVTLQLSDAAGSVLYRAAEPATVELGRILQIDVKLGRPAPEAGPVPGKYTMPNLVGQSEGMALAVLDKLGLPVSVRDREEEGEPDLVVVQSPRSGAAVDGPARVTLTIRRAPARRGAAKKKPD